MAYDYIKVSDVQPQGTDDGTFESGDWRIRTINTKDTDTGGHCSIANNQITLAAGTYEVSIKCPADCVNYHQARLYNITDNEETLLGTTECSNSTYIYTTSSVIIGRFTIAAQKTFEIQHKCLSTCENVGLGARGNLTNEVYTVAEFRKVA